MQTQVGANRLESSEFFILEKETNDWIGRKYARIKSFNIKDNPLPYYL